ncbi:MAG: outer membrane protein assembly factor BamE [Hyphomonadaceae bacterium]|nr:outer membrane protein assembly factor BamE [Hyphomonadaceae bacterium]
MNRHVLRLSAVALMAAAATACVSPVQTYSGFSAERNNQQIADPQVGVDTQDTVRQRFGSPSTTAVFDQTTWYYVSQVQEQRAFFRPTITERQVIAVRFAENNTVSAVEKFGLERGRVVNLSDDVTPTRGRELGVLEQIFGNIGNSSPIRSQDDEIEENRRR